MCLAIPAQIIKMSKTDHAIVCIGGIEKEISLALVEGVSIGDYVIIHVGFALTKLDEAEARNTLKMLEAMYESSDRIEQS